MKGENFVFKGSETSYVCDALRECGLLCKQTGETKEDGSYMRADMKELFCLPS
jgi:hypothetical protein